MVHDRPAALDQGRAAEKAGKFEQGHVDAAAIGAAGVGPVIDQPEQLPGPRCPGRADNEQGAELFWLRCPVEQNQAVGPVAVEQERIRSSGCPGKSFIPRSHNKAMPNWL